MNFAELLHRVVEDTVGKAPLQDLGRVFSGLVPTFLDGSLLMFLPELVITATILLLLLGRLFGWERLISGQSTALCGAAAALGIASAQYLALKNYLPADGSIFSRQEFFTGLLVYDALTVFFKVFLLLFLVLVVYFTKLSGIPDREDAPDFYTLLFGSTLGMLVMIQSNHLLMVFLGIEMTSVPSYALVGFLKGRKTSSEAAFKYVVYGAGAAGVMLYGISLLAGLLGTASLPVMAQRIALVISAPTVTLEASLATLILATVMVLVGFAFKLSIFPFHFWCPDAFEGAAAEVAGFLSIASKGAAFALLVRFCLALSGVFQPVPLAISPVLLYLGVGIGVIATVTITFGNLAAYSQNNMKRMLAYSTIAHAGVMLLGVSAMMVTLNATHSKVELATRWDQAAVCLQGILFYLWVYLFMNLGAFAIVAVIRNEIYSEDMRDYAGLWVHSPAIAVAAVVCLFSLVGIPPFGGFLAKFMIFWGVFQATPYHWAMWPMLIMAGLNTVFSLFYYIRVLKIMFIEAPKEDGRRVVIPSGSAPALFTSGMAAIVLLLGIIAAPLSDAARNVASVMFP